MSDTTFEEIFDSKPASSEKPEPAPAPQAADDAAKPNPEPAPAAVEPEKPKIEPEQFKGYLDEREKRQQAEREREELRRELTRLQQAAPKEPPPNIYDNPEGYQQHLQAQYDQRLTQMKLEQSEFLATRDYGAETIGKVKDWAMRLDPARANSLIASASPFHAAVEAYRQEQAAAVLKKYDYDLDKMKSEWAKELQAARPAAPQPGAPSSPQQPLPPKVAGAGGLVGSAPVQSEDDFFRSVFQR